MTRKFTLFLASMLIVFSAGATMPTIGTITADEQPATVAADESEDEGFWWGASFDMASNYIWRGFDQPYAGGNRNMFDPALQPGVTLGYGNFYIDLWANRSLISTYTEFDVFLGYENENLTVTLYDVLWGVSEDMSTMNPLKGENHSLTATIDYTLFERLRLHWATTFIHSGDKLINGKQAYSSYFEVAYDFSLSEVDFTVAAAVLPFAADYYGNDDFGVCNLNITAGYEFEFDNGATLPISGQVMYNPMWNECFWGVSVGYYFSLDF